MSDIYTLDDMADLERAVALLKEKNLALIGRGKSQDQFKFNLSTTICLWVNPENGWRELVKTIYGEVWQGKHIACISGYHPELVDRFYDQNADVNIFTFQDKQSKWNIPGAYPAFLFYLSKIIEITGKKLYLVGLDMDELGRSFQSEIDGIRAVYREVSERVYHNILRVWDYKRIPFHVMSQDELIQDENIHLFPEGK